MRKSFSKETREKAERTKEYLEMKYNKMQRFRRDKKSRERNFKERLNRSNLSEAEKAVARKEFARGYVFLFHIIWMFDFCLFQSYGCLIWPCIEYTPNLCLEKKKMSSSSLYVYSKRFERLFQSYER